MKNTFFALFTILIFSGFQAENVGKISVTIPEIKKPGKGELIIILHSEESTFPGDSEGAFQCKKFREFGTSITHVFENVPYGIYAISLHHDRDLSGKLNRNFLGIPSEPVGVSNMTWIGYPRFSKSKFELRESFKEMEVVFLNN